MSVMHGHLHRVHPGRLEASIRSAFLSAGSLLLTIVTILFLFFGVFLARSR